MKTNANKKVFKNRILDFKKQLSGWVLIIPAIVIIYFMIIRPQIMGIAWSFFDMRGYNIKSFNGLDNYRTILSNTEFLQILWNTCQYVLWSMIGYIIPIIVAVVLNEVVHFRRFFRFVVYFPSVLPGTAVMLLWFMMFYPDQAGLLNMILGKVFHMTPYNWLQDSRFTILYIIISMTWNSAGMTALYYFASLQGVSRELYEASLIDGAGFMKRFWTITFPHMSGILLLFLIKQIMGVFQIVDQPMQMTGGGPGNASMTLGYWSYKYAFEYNKPQYSMVIGVIMFLILMVLTSFYFAADKKVQSKY